MKRARNKIEAEGLGDRIRERLKALGKTPRGASIEAGLGASTIRNLLEGRSQAPRIDTLAAIARVLQISPRWLLENESDNINANNDYDTVVLEKAVRKKGVIIQKDENRFRDTLPLYAPYLSEDGVLALYSTFMMVSFAAFEVEKSDKLSAIIVRDSRMEPAYYTDDIILVTREMEVRVSEDYLFESIKEKQDSDRLRFYIFARLVEMTEDNLVLLQHNPRRQFNIKRSEFDPHPLAVVGKAFRKT